MIGFAVVTPIELGFTLRFLIAALTAGVAKPDMTVLGRREIPSIVRMACVSQVSAELVMSYGAE